MLVTQLVGVKVAVWVMLPSPSVGEGLGMRTGVSVLNEVAVSVAVGSKVAVSVGVFPSPSVGEGLGMRMSVGGGNSRLKRRRFLRYRRNEQYQ